MPSLHLGVVATANRVFGSPLTKVANYLIDQKAEKIYLCKSYKNFNKNTQEIIIES